MTGLDVLRGGRGVAAENFMVIVWATADQTYNHIFYMRL